MKRAALIAAAVVALLLSVPWWLGTGLLADSYDSACEDSVWADLTFVAANIGFLLGLGALIDAARPKGPRVAAVLLAIYAVLILASFLVGATCE